jgi:hypothetical protein
VTKAFMAVVKQGMPIGHTAAMTALDCNTFVVAPEIIAGILLKKWPSSRTFEN